jgi:hypothetical protein
MSFEKPFLRKICFGAITGFIILLFSISSFAEYPLNSEYVGAKVCAKCHEEIYNAWKTSGHAKILRKASNVDAILSPFLRGIPVKMSLILQGASNGRWSYDVKYQDLIIRPGFKLA